MHNGHDTILILDFGSKEVVTACGGCKKTTDGQAKCYPGDAGWPLLQLYLP